MRCKIFEVTIMSLGWTGSYENMHIAHWAASNFTVRSSSLRNSRCR